MTQVWEYSRFRGTRLLLLLAIADHCNDDLIAWPSRKHLSKKIRMGERFTKRLIDELLATEPHELSLLDPGGGRGHSPRYKILIAGHDHGMRSDMQEVHKGGGGDPLLAKGGSRVPIKGGPEFQKTVKGGSIVPERGVYRPPEPSLTTIKTLTQTATATTAPAAAVANGWGMEQLAQSAKLPKAKRSELTQASGTAFVSKYLYALAHPGFRKPALWAAAQVIDNPSTLEGQPFGNLASLGPIGLAHVLAWMRDEGAYPLNVNGATGAALAFRGHMQARHSKEPARMYVALDDAISDLGLSALAVPPAAPAELPAEDYQPEPEAAPTIWDAIRETLVMEYPSQKKRLASLSLVSAEPDAIVLAVPSQPELAWLNNRMGKMLAERFKISLRLED